MRTLVRSVGRASIGGEPLPSCFKAFENNKIIIRRSEVSMFAAAPGVGKSTLALALALKMKVPTLYISADTNAHTMAMRLASMISGKSQSDVERMLVTDIGWTKATLARGSHIVWSFESAPSLQDIDEEVQAFEELWGCPPTLIVVDNLMDVATDGGEEFASMRAIMKELKYLARATNEQVCAYSFIPFIGEQRTQRLLYCITLLKQSKAILANPVQRYRARSHNFLPSSVLLVLSVLLWVLHL